MEILRHDGSTHLTASVEVARQGQAKSEECAMIQRVRASPAALACSLMLRPLTMQQGSARCRLKAGPVAAAAAAAPAAAAYVAGWPERERLRASRAAAR